jgi:hypothetical protein
MSLTFNKKFTEIVDFDNFGVIHIKTTSHNFRNRFMGISSFFKSLKNGLYSVNKIPNRVYFRGFSGVYLSLEIDSQFEILILYNPLKTPLNSLQVKTRIIKLLGLGTQVNIGVIKDYQEEIDRISRIKTESRVFGDYYSKPNIEV